MPDIQHADLTGSELHYPRGWFQSGAGITLTPSTNSAFVVTSSKSANDFIRYSSLLTLETMTYGAPAQRPVWRGYLNNFVLDLEESETDAFFLTVDGNADPLLWIDTEDAADPQTVNVDGFFAFHQQAAEPVTPVANGVSVYARDVAGTAHLFAQSDDGTEHQLTPPSTGATPGGSDAQLQYNDGGSAFGGLANVEHDGGGNLLLLEDTPSAPGAGTLVPHARTEAIPLLSTRINGESPMLVGLPWSSSHVFIWRPYTSSLVHEIGGPSSAVQGTATTPSATSGTMLSRSFRSRMTSVASTNQAAGRYISGVTFIALETGLWLKFRVALPAMNSNGLAFVGLTADASSVAGSSSPSAFLNCIGFGKNSGDTNWQVISNDGSGGAVSHVDLGSDFATSSTTAIIDFVLYAPAGGSTVAYWANRVDSAVTPVSGTISTDLPASSVFMVPRVWLSTGTTLTTAVVMDLLFMDGFKEV